MSRTLAQVLRTVLRGLRSVAHGCRTGASPNRAGRWAGFSVLLALPLCVAVVSAAGAEPTPPLKIGVVDIGVIFQAYHRISDIENQLDGEIARYEALVAARRERVEALERAARTPVRRRLFARSSAQELTQARAALREARREANEELRLLEEQATAAVLADVRRAAAREAAVQELDLVLDRTDASLLFVRAGTPLVVDVTDAVLARLNAP